MLFVATPSPSCVAREDCGVQWSPLYGRTNNHRLLTLFSMWILLGFIAVPTLMLTANILMNGSEAVIDITPRNGTVRRTTGAQVPCLVGWGMMLLIAWGIRFVGRLPESAFKSKPTDSAPDA